MIVSSSYTGPVAAAFGRDETGLVGLVFWSDQVKEVSVGDVVRIESGWCRSRDGALVVSTGNHGKLSIVRRFDTLNCADPSRNHKEGEVMGEIVRSHFHE